MVWEFLEYKGAIIYFLKCLNINMDFWQKQDALK